ncbi:hypothetical protein PFISCL1PPCAC_28195 [Pristionchus fissidentatus]|uniref:CUB domain-containing protein n=1 Tax=Pristionchus fissidentatus TaxID=1538716 RepID=A0AAV5X2R7_9BILA|nr:hypothetical protein PFISCL1PPCAC_28195 [Pristionchus fissidentatus]
MLFHVALLSFLALTQACSDGWSAVNGIDDCFKVFEISKSFYDAEDWCVQNGGHLASIHSSAEEYNLHLLLGGRSPLIGLKCASATSCSWTDGTPYDYTNFVYGAPTLEYGSCAYLFSADDQFYSWNCATPMNAFLCRMTNTTENPCSPGYTQYLGSCVTVKTIYKTSDDAERECVVEGGHLASIHDIEADNTFTNLLLSLGLNQNAHIGLRLQSNSLMQWTDSSIVNFQNWGWAYPNTYFGFCAQLLGTNEFGAIGQWSNIPCDTKLPYICMKPQGVSPVYAPFQCPSMQYFENTGTIYSPGFPLAVPSNSTCEYLLAGVEGSILMVAFPYFAIDPYSTLSLYDGMSAPYPIAVLSGSLPTNVAFNTTESIMKMVFETSSQSYGDGWEANFISILPAPTGSTARATTQKTTTVRTTTVRTTTLKTTTTKRGQTTPKSSSCEPQYLYAPVMIDSPGYPLGYPMNANCVYYVSGNPGKQLVLDFTYVDTKWSKDYVSIRDGPYENSLEIGRVSGMTLQNNLRYITTTNYVTLVFVSDGTPGGAGWVVSVSMSP